MPIKSRTLPAASTGKATLPFMVALAMAVIAAPAPAQSMKDGSMPGHAATAHGHDHEGGETSFGKPGHAGKSVRTIDIVMSDGMRFTPADISVKKGETIRFTVRNDGKIRHEFVLGTMQDLKAHAESMKKNPAMGHTGDEDHAVGLDAGKRGTVLWQFSKAGKFYFGCLVPGHLEAGMIGTVTVK